MADSAYLSTCCDQSGATIRANGAGSFLCGLFALNDWCAPCDRESRSFALLAEGDSTTEETRYELVVRPLLVAIEPEQSF